jgi:hypothetical protein
MDTPQKYLEKTRSAVDHLFKAIDSYRAILEPSSNLVFSGSFSTPREAEDARNEWVATNKSSIQRSLAAQREYIAETVSIAVLSGAVLSMAEKFLELFSKNQSLVDGLGFELKPGKVKYCVGRVVRGVPLGLIIHAGRNQHFHFESISNHSPVPEVFSVLSQRVSEASGASYSDPAFELNEQTRPYMAANVLHLIGWQNALEYSTELNAMIGENEN